MQYRVTARYKSDAGQFQGGEVVDLPEAEAAWFNRDYPGLMVPVVEEVPAEEEIPAEEEVPAEEEETTLPDAPPHDRMMQAAPKKRGKGA